MQILYEDNHLIAVNKRPSELVQGDKTGDIPLLETVKSYIKAKYNKPGAAFLGVIHRLDRPVSGVVIFARTSKALARMNEMFRRREVSKTYWAIVKGSPPRPEARLVHYIMRNERQNKSYAYEQEKDRAKRASLSYRTLARSESYSLLEVKLETGRHHQIRCQLATIGCPIKGDLKYGAARSNPAGGICLHAACIDFIHPVGGGGERRVRIVAPPPEDEKLWQILLQNGSPFTPSLP